jgi:hypothetical protein
VPGAHPGSPLVANRTQVECIVSGHGRVRRSAAEAPAGLPVVPKTNGTSAAALDARVAANGVGQAGDHARAVRPTSRVMRPVRRRYGSERAGISQAPGPCGRGTPGTHGENRPAAPDARKVWVSG